MPRKKSPAAVASRSAREEVKELQAALANALATQDEDGTDDVEMKSLSVAIPVQMYDHLEAFAESRRSTKSDIVRKALARDTGFDLSAVAFVGRRRRTRYASEAERKRAEQLRYQTDRAMLRAAKELISASGPEADRLRSYLADKGIPLQAA